MKSRFISRKGVQVSAVLNLINITGNYRLGIGWLSTVGNLTAEIHSLKMDTIISVEVNSIGMPQFNIESCKANDSYVFVTVDGSLSSLINSMNDILGDILRDTLDQLLCDSAREASMAVRRRYDVATGESKPSPLCPKDPEYSNPSGKMSAFSINASMVENPTIFRDSVWIGLNGTMLYNGQNPNYQPVQYSLKNLK